MPHSVSLITTLAAGLGLAALFGFLAVRLKMPALVGYLVAGIVIGPATPGFVADAALSRELAELGVILLMFGVGLHFSLDELLSVRHIAVPGAVLQIAVATLMGMAACFAWGWSAGTGLVFGLSLSVASTVVLLRSLESRGLLKSVQGRIAVGWLVVEDVVTVLLLVLLPAVAVWLGGTAPGGLAAGHGVWYALFVTLGQVAVFIGIMIVVGRRVIPWLLWQVARSNSRELFTLCVVAAAVGIAFLSAELFGVSLALGAFFAGTVMRESALSHRAADESLPLRDAFSVLFFVSVGMLFDPGILVHEPIKLLVVLLIILLGKTLAALSLVLAFRYPLMTALTISVSLAQIGEFSFILASMGMSMNLISVEANSLILAGAIVSIALNPFMFGLIEPACAFLRARPMLARALEVPHDPLSELPVSIDQQQLTGHVVIVGFGRVGSRIGEALLKRGIPIVVAEQIRETVEKLRGRGVNAVAGDASEPEVLVQAHLLRARMLVVALPDAFRARKVIETARAMRPQVEIIVRTHSDEETTLLEQEGTDAAFFGEHELALGMTRHILERWDAGQAESAGRS